MGVVTKTKYLNLDVRNIFAGSNPEHHCGFRVQLKYRGCKFLLFPESSIAGKLVLRTAPSLPANFKRTSFRMNAILPQFPIKKDEDWSESMQKCSAAPKFDLGTINMSRSFAWILPTIDFKWDMN
jgi:hypothetical protein